MNYKGVFKNKHFLIKVNTDSNAIYTLIKRFLDLSDTLGSSVRKINIYFYFNFLKDKILDDSKKLLFHSYFNKNNLYTAAFGNRIAEITVDPKRKIVRGNIFHFDELYKECFLDFIFSQPLRFILAHYGLFFLHASAVCKGKDCILFSGKQSSGKTTLALSLAQNGFKFLADDDCFVKSSQRKNIIIPLPTKAGLTDKLIRRFPEFKQSVLKNYAYGDKQRISLNNFSLYAKPQKYVCKILLFPKFKAHTKITLNPLSKEEALRRLINENSSIYSRPGYKKLSVNNFWTLYNFTNKVKAFEIIYSDEKLNEIPSIVDELLIQSKI